MITIIGSYNVGLFLKSKKFPEIGETIISNQFFEGGGGKGSNQAISAAKFGAKTRFIGRLGADKYGIDALQMYNDYKVSVDLVKIDPTIHSGISVILIDGEGNNLIAVAPGANFKFSKQDIDSSLEFLKDSFIVGFQLENELEVVSYGIKKVHELNITTYLDPAPAKKLPDEIYQYIDIIKPNETEAHTLTGIVVHDVESAENAGKWFIERGVKNAIVTLGEKGAVLVTADACDYFPAPKVTTIDTTGAGDIFSGAFFYLLQKGKKVNEAIEFAVVAASLSTTKMGVIESIPVVEDVFNFMNNIKVKLVRA
ncbi:MAG: ribokinase [Paludibacter sp.]|jgi:ribokinase